MKNKILLFGLIIVIIGLLMTFGYTNARYYSTASMTGDLDYIRTIGKISIYHPEWVSGYKGADDGSGVFEISQIPVAYENIHYVVTNKLEEQINEEEVEYYIRIVAEDESNNIPIEYNVHEYNTPGKILPKVEEIGYGPFKLEANSEITQQYSIRVNWTSKEAVYLKGVQHLKVQMVKKRIDETLKVIDEAPLNMEFTGAEVKATFKYYLYGTTKAVRTDQTLNMADNFTIDFKNSTQLNELGIIIPSGYSFHDVRHNINNANEYSGTATTVEIPEGPSLSGYTIEVYLVSNAEVAVQLAYYDYTNYETDANGNRKYKEISNSGQTVVITRGTKLDFKNETQMSDLGINLPTGYTLQGLDDGENGNLVTNKYTDTSVTIPSTNVDISHYLEVYMNPAGSAIVKLSYYNSSVSADNLIESQTLSSVGVGTKINFTKSSSLSNLGIVLPTGYEFNIAYCNQLDSTGTGGEEFEIPYSGVGKTYNIDVVLDKVLTTITVPVKFYKDNGGVEEFIKETTLDMRSDGTYEFTTGICRTLCPELNAMTSFTIYVANQWNSTYEVGNTYSSSSVTVDYNATYTSWADFKLTDEGSYISIKAWW